MAEKSYTHMKAQMIADIASGQFKPHERLPSQRELGRLYGLSHMSVRRAINELTSEGIILLSRSRKPNSARWSASPKI
jgi:DNA-binding GntR family transcriptional regulator